MTVLTGTLVSVDVFFAQSEGWDKQEVGLLFYSASGRAPWHLRQKRRKVK